ncbi:MAG: hypothetical protein IT307_15545, partial [Chloroflexi bacterium]|nr:hypothetical protein [Chloroflexota bacterium]
MSERTSQARPTAVDGTGSRKRLLYIANIDFPSVRARSIQVVHTCHALATLGWRVSLVVGRREAPPLRQYLERYGLADTAGLRLVGVPAPRVPVSAPRALRVRYSRIWGLGFTAGVLARLPGLVLSERPNLIMVRDYRMAWTLLGLSHLHRTPLVFEAHNLPSLE